MVQHSYIDIRINVIDLIKVDSVLQLLTINKHTRLITKKTYRLNGDTGDMDLMTNIIYELKAKQDMYT